METHSGLSRIEAQAFSFNLLISVHPPASVDVRGKYFFVRPAHFPRSQLTSDRDSSRLGSRPFSSNVVKSIHLPASVEGVGAECFSEETHLMRVGPFAVSSRDIW
jgi:hypothetical protein